MKYGEIATFLHDLITITKRGDDYHACVTGDESQLH
jgi:hypothetical protein